MLSVEFHNIFFERGFYALVLRLQRLEHARRAAELNDRAGFLGNLREAGEVARSCRIQRKERRAGFIPARRSR